MRNNPYEHHKNLIQAALNKINGNDSKDYLPQLNSDPLNSQLTIDSLNQYVTKRGISVTAFSTDRPTVGELSKENLNTIENNETAKIILHLPGHYVAMKINKIQNNSYQVRLFDSLSNSFGKHLGNDNQTMLKLLIQTRLESQFPNANINFVDLSRPMQGTNKCFDCATAFLETNTPKEEQQVIHTSKKDQLFRRISILKEATEDMHATIMSEEFPTMPHALKENYYEFTRELVSLVSGITQNQLSSYQQNKAIRDIETNIANAGFSIDNQGTLLADRSTPKSQIQQLLNNVKAVLTINNDLLTVYTKNQQGKLVTTNCIKSGNLILARDCDNSRESIQSIDYLQNLINQNSNQEDSNCNIM